MAAPEQQQPGTPATGPGDRRGRGISAGQLGGGLLIGRPFGVPIYISASWLLFIAFITVQFAPVVANAVPGIGGSRYIVSAAFGVFLGLSVLAHEAAHCAVARRFGIPIDRISLSFLAGHSVLADEPRTPGRASAVAGAGPVTNLLIAVCSWFALHQLPSGSIGAVLFAGLTWSNAVVGVYNLLPGLPLDGGQLLRGALWRLTRNPRTGTIGAAWAGRVIAACTALLGIYFMAARRTEFEVSGLWAILIAGMLWVSSTQVLRQQALRDRLPGISARALSRSSISVSADLPLAEAVRRAQEAHAQGIVIVDDDGRPTGVVKEAAVTAMPAPRRPWVSAGSVARHVSPGELIDASWSGEQLLMKLQLAAASEYVVVDPAGSVYGVLAAADVARALAGSAA
ncbi:MAG TPA: site-2 protease family protein [Acidothermaceae bacterium]|jgi:Zn-dependent protease|nr:site-2 protease family protein [Acidothermaceae bacterium]